MRDIDVIIARLELAYPDISVEQLSVLHRDVDDNGLWFFRHPATDIEVQLESSTGTCPFLFESSGSPDRLNAGNIDHAVALVVAGLGLSLPAA
jgi:hypothetical protein